MNAAVAGEGVAARRPILEYWPEVDGLRTIAVLSVFVFHFDRAWLGGGFVGVDIFFVISGFLISAILLEDRAHGRFSLTRFYQRRIARIAPAFFLVVAATLLGAWLVYSAQDFSSTGSGAAYAAISLINVKYMLIGDYFAISPDAQPLLHYWSLAVEEQFYLFFPLYLYAVTMRPRWALPLTLVLAVASLALCVAVTHYKPVYAFYLLPTRGWELLAGVAVTMLRWRDIRLPAQVVPWLAWAGLALVLASVLLVREGPYFPGIAALAPVLGTAMILATVGEPRAALNRWLAKPLPVYIGKRSYSLYLWHWPVFSLVDYQLFATDGWARGALKIGITLVATWLSYRYVERPARSFFNQPPQRLAAYAGFAVVAAAAFAGGTAVRNAWFLDAAPGSIASGGIAAATGTHGNIVLLGDSQATMYARPIALFAREHGYSFNSLGVPDSEQLPGRPGTAWPQIWGYVSSHPVNLVIIAEAWDDKFNKDPAALGTAVAQLTGRGIKVILVHQIPGAPANATRDGIRHGARPPFAEDPVTAPDRLTARAGVAALAGPAVRVVDPAPLLLKPDGSIDLVAANGRLNYHDGRHVSDTGAARVMPLLGAAIDESLKR